MDNSSLEAAITKMIELTQSKKIKWETINLRRENICCQTYVENIGHAMIATISVNNQEKSFSLYRYSYRFFTEDGYDEYTICEDTQLDFCDPITYNTIWSFPASSLIPKLYETAIIQSEGIDDFINSFLE